MKTNIPLDLTVYNKKRKFVVYIDNGHDIKILHQIEEYYVDSFKDAMYLFGSNPKSKCWIKKYDSTYGFCAFYGCTKDQIFYENLRKFALFIDLKLSTNGIFHWLNKSDFSSSYYLYLSKDLEIRISDHEPNKARIKPRHKNIIITKDFEDYDFEWLKIKVLKFIRRIKSENQLIVFNELFK